MFQTINSTVTTTNWTVHTHTYIHRFWRFADHESQYIYRFADRASQYIYRFADRASQYIYLSI